MDYVHSNPGTEIIFHANDMIQQTHFNTEYLIAKNAQSQVSGFDYCGDKYCTGFWVY